MNQLYSIITIVLLFCFLPPVTAMAQRRQSTATPAGVVTALLNIAVDEEGKQNPAKMRAERALLEKSLKTTPIDLDGDGTPEFIVKVERPSVCGAGGNCNHYVFHRVRGGYELLLQESGQRLYALNNKSSGYRDLVVEGHVSASESYVHEYAWNGAAYERSECKSKKSFGQHGSMTTTVSCDPDAAPETPPPVDLDSMASNARNSRLRNPEPAPMPVPEPVPVPQQTAPEITPQVQPLPSVPRSRVILMNGVFPVAARGYRAFPFRLAPNGVSILRGQIAVQGGAGMDINFCVTDYPGYLNYVNNRVFNAVFCSGRVQLRQFELALPPGDYFIIFDNRYSLLANKNVVGFVEIIQ